MAGRGGYSAFYAAQTGTKAIAGSDALAQALGTAVQGATQVKFRSASKKGSQRLTVRPATPVEPVSTFTPAPAPTPGWFQTVRADGTLGPNWPRIALVGGGALALLVAVGAIAKRRR